MANLQNGDITLAKHCYHERKVKVKLIIANNQQTNIVKKKSQVIPSWYRYVT